MSDAFRKIRRDWFFISYCGVSAFVLTFPYRAIWNVYKHEQRSVSRAFKSDFLRVTLRATMPKSLGAVALGVVGSAIVSVFVFDEKNDKTT